MEVDLQWWPYKQETTAMIRRVVEHPWPPAEEEASEDHSLSQDHSLAEAEEGLQPLSAGLGVVGHAERAWG